MSICVAVSRSTEAYSLLAERVGLALLVVTLGKTLVIVHGIALKGLVLQQRVVLTMLHWQPVGIHWALEPQGGLQPVTTRTHCPLREVCPAGQEHRPFVQMELPVQTVTPS